MTRLALALAATLAALALAAPAQVAGDEGLTPPDGFLADWRRVGAAQLFVGPTLYDHIDGAGELFFEFGFEAVAVQRYARGDERFVLEIYRMSDPTAALGLYLMKAGREQRDPSLAARHTVGQFQLACVVGRRFILATSDGAAGLREALLAAGRWVAARLPAADPVAALELLPGEGLVAGSERLIRGPLALQPLIHLWEGNPLELGLERTAAAGDYQPPGGTPFTLLVAPYANEQAARSALRRVSQRLDPELRVTARGEGSLRFVAPSGASGEARVSGSRLVLRLGLRAE